ncbi:spermidine/putrescine ABC transporter ATP-binding subunit [Thermobifida fusca YX]|uniref:Spermidine/putrescine import ATP-binding protein PotA n=1 Tax=Thermobifida fusca (strain YX) TaxID=269800 RepID=POTA_THEFY|nr:MULTISPECIES: ABC transporter ATP-binding protein [Thermobifida]Q47T99.1 RecName: Full=Spermidine/putrescine import ATP-binding protein PotA [Thermobifida fusca YX]AAZ54318.1 spermidine/putrescine ABC transporter ATP-binding subunit [Thermobifida fusca YX]MBO2529820.1 spermidine/putrescine ABC transporter ATP-binding protein [Thermobifida sp.]PPS94068.1 spermidine/putrescine ABC transporter ATP-binding protein [Thermobifida fusca]PZN62246.1 MAG: spermidine/putrescine ABC transporter ATP-bin
MATTTEKTPAAPGVVATESNQAVPAISLEKVSKTYRSGQVTTTAVESIDLEIRQGEFFSLLGPSGCGKTTTMRMIAGFEEPTSGVVRLSGKDVTGVPPNRRDVNMVFQSYALFPHMTVAENVAFGLKRKKVPAAEIRTRVAEMLELVELGDRAKYKPRQLSGGQQQRVALARALVNRPSALLLDEPLGALDLKLRQAMQLELKRIQREVGITFVYVTHDQSEALTMSDRIAVMNKGRIEQLGTPAQIYETPATRFVAGFIGTSNILTGTAQRVSDTLVRIDYGGDQHVLANTPQQMSDLGLVITVRPEKIRLGKDVPDANVSRIRGTVREVVYLGATTHYTVRTVDDTDIVVFQQNSSDASNLADHGDTVWLSWRPEHSYVLPG